MCGGGGGLIVVFTFSVLTQRLYRDLATCSDSNTAKSSFDRSSTEQTHTQRERGGQEACESGFIVL